jgi:hypothetical protein
VQATHVPPGRVPRIARLLALAIRFEYLLRAGIIADYRVIVEFGVVGLSRDDNGQILGSIVVLKRFALCDVK